MIHYAGEALERQVEAIHHLVTQDGTITEACSATLEALIRADPLYWIEKTSREVFEIGNTINLNDYQVSPELLHVPYAWCWFEVPWLTLTFSDVLADERGPYVYPVKAIMWALVQSESKGIGILVSAFGFIASQLVEMFTAAAGYGGVTCAEYEQFGKDVPEAERAARDGLVKFAISANTFIRQDLVVTESQPLNRPTRKRLLASALKDHSFVKNSFAKIVLLRKMQRPERSSVTGGTPIEHDCHWWVGAHMRRQWYPSIQKHLPIIISPYIKGDLSKPLKPRTTSIFLVNR